MTVILKICAGFKSQENRNEGPKFKVFHWTDSLVDINNAHNKYI